MADNLKLFGTTYQNVTGFKAKDTGNVIQTYAKPSYTLLATKEFEVSTTSTSATRVGNVSLPLDAWTSDKILYVRVRDKAGARVGYFVESDTFFTNNTKATVGVRIIISRAEGNPPLGKMSTGTGSTGYGVFAQSTGKTQTDFIVNIDSRYNSTWSLTIDGTYVVEVYLLDWPDGISPFE